MTTAVARDSFEAFATPCALPGHTHLPVAWRENGRTVELLRPGDGLALRLDKRRLLLNPGSVGQPRDGDPRASAMILDTEAGTAIWRRVPYPVTAVQAEIRAVGLPPRLADRLELGL